MISTTYALLIIIVAAATTFFIRLLPFLLFSHGGEPPKWVTYLGRVLPPALMSFLLIYCIRNVDFHSMPDAFPSLISIAAAVILHIWKRNTLLSIGVSTVLYMVLLHLM